jgi:uncharacterized short protein YbdD (DUF466 family)
MSHVSAVSAAASGAASEAAAPQSFATRLKRAFSTLRRIIGVPDYDTYLEHMQRRYPDCTPMDARTFERERLAEKYRRGGTRCC